MSKKYDNNLNEIKDNVPIKTFSITSGGVNIENLGQPVNIDTYEEENKQLKQQLAEKDKEIERLKEEICKYEITLMERNSQLKDQRHQICEKIREWYREQELIMEEWLIDCLDQIEKEKKNENFEEK